MIVITTGLYSVVEATQFPFFLQEFKSTEYFTMERDVKVISGQISPIIFFHPHHERDSNEWYGMDEDCIETLEWRSSKDLQRV